MSGKRRGRKPAGERQDAFPEPRWMLDWKVPLRSSGPPCESDDSDGTPEPTEPWSVSDGDKRTLNLLFALHIAEHYVKARYKLPAGLTRELDKLRTRFAQFERHTRLAYRVRQLAIEGYPVTRGHADGDETALSIAANEFHVSVETAERVYLNGPQFLKA